jgi:hypothetical protein
VSIIIAPALVRRYLRATGWVLEASGSWTDPDERWVITASEVEKPMTGLAPRHLVNLGLCVAAEDAMKQARAIEADETLTADCCAQCVRIEVNARAARYFEWAGVDPAKWEASR